MLAQMVWGTYLEKNFPSSNGHILVFGGILTKSLVADDGDDNDDYDDVIGFQGDLRETQDGCDGCPGPLGG